MNIFQDKIVVITGAASGIGRALSEHLAQRKAKVIMVDKNESLLRDAVERIKQSGGWAKPAVVDVSKLEEVKNMIEDVVREHKRLDYLFNNAGIAIIGEAQFFEMCDWTDVLNVNLYGVINGIFVAYPIMLKQGFGHIVNTASGAGLFPLPGQASYVASKYAVVGISNTLRIEGADFGVKVSVVCPGLIQTPIYNSVKMIRLDKEKVIARAGKGANVERCAKEIIRGVEKNKAIIVVTLSAKILWILQRLSPALVRWIWLIVMRELRRYRTPE